jgi:hypothetical protein
MKKITLYAANATNDLKFADAGTTLTIGDGATEISAARAKAAVDGGMAVSETAAKADQAAADPATKTPAKDGETK